MAPAAKTAGVVVAPGGERGARVLAHAGGRRIGAAIAVEALEIEPEIARMLPQMRVVEPALVGVQQVDEGPERALGGGGLGGAGDGDRALGLGAQREVAEGDVGRRAVRRSWASAQRGQVKSA